jgi:alanyl-tRNA synthetase
MDSQQIRSVFTDFYRRRGHSLIVDSSLLSPDGDDVLFTTSGMHSLTPYLQGRPHPQGERLVNVQRCLRTTDLEEVGDSTHLTMFQMLGSWSLGNYSHEQSLRWGYELLRDGLGVDPSRLHVTVFGGDDQVGLDQESLRVWNELGVPVELTVEDNWWSNGPTGPCGPDSEIFFWTGSHPPTGTPGTDDRWVEIWNHVSMRYLRHDDGSRQPLVRRNVDTGMGLERISMLLQGRDSVYETDLLEPWIRHTGPLWTLTERNRRIVVDHLRSSLVLLGDGVRPSNKGRGYVLRRLLRRVLTILWEVDTSPTVGDLPPELFELTRMQFDFRDEGLIQWRELLLTEENRFRTLIHRGRPLVRQRLSNGPLTEDDLLFLQDTHGLPRELVLGLLRPSPGPTATATLTTTGVPTTSPTGTAEPGQAG